MSSVSFRQMWPTTSWIAFNQTSCLHLSQKVVQYLISILAKKSFTLPQVFYFLIIVLSLERYIFNSKKELEELKFYDA